jgi:hypothetical protein
MLKNDSVGGSEGAPFFWTNIFNMTKVKELQICQPKMAEIVGFQISPPLENCDPPPSYLWYVHGSGFATLLTVFCLGLRRRMLTCVDLDLATFISCPFWIS